MISVLPQCKVPNQGVFYGHFSANDSKPDHTQKGPNCQTVLCFWQHHLHMHLCVWTWAQRSRQQTQVHRFMLFVHFVGTSVTQTNEHVQLSPCKCRENTHGYTGTLLSSHRQLSVFCGYNGQFQLADNQVEGYCRSTLIHFDEITFWVSCYSMSVNVTISGPKTLLWGTPLYLSVLDFLIFITWVWDFFFRSFSRAEASEGIIFFLWRFKGIGFLVLPSVLNRTEIMFAFYWQP